ncbi:uncharacterized protein LOC126743413 [Anthonomus grandis grandis]|uniref:uncharacterized protein LOC126743413 n=1 Tax=Anthonomus grandis grandis TaxID=2921223 RepID=UPI0021651922|nr:uncharacterized protein LOC126743413 [Anthonomus grandis grandis]
MALLKSKTKELPEDAVVLSPQDALKYQMDIVKQWHKTSDVLALRYGPYILGTTALLSGIFYNNYFRKKFMLGHLGRLSTYLPISVVPATLTAVLHTELVLKDIILLKSDQCPLCLQTRAAILQVGFSTIFPIIIGPMGCAAVAMRYGTFNLPYLHEKPKEVFNIFRKMFTKIQTKSMYFMIGQAFLASVVTYYEAKNLFTISAELARYDSSSFDE